MATSPSTRRHDLDWLRVLVILVVFVFHCGRFFDTDGWHVKNPVRHPAVQVWTVFLVCWMMPLIFVISGASTFYALGARRTGQFVKDRALRLLVPLFVGIFSHIALQVYLERVSFSGFKGSFFKFYPLYFHGLYGLGGNFAWMGLHLWYLEALFVSSVLSLPLLVWWKAGGGRRWLDMFGNLFVRGGMIYLPALAPALLIGFLDPKTFWGQRGFGGWPLPAYLFYFLYGFILVSREALDKQVEKLRWCSLAGGAGLFLVLCVAWKMGADPAPGTGRYEVLLSLFGLSSWGFILGFLGLARRRLDFSNSFLSYANEAVLPFYVLHQTIILTLGFFIVRWAIPDSLKFLLIAGSAFPLIAGSYEFGIRRNNPMRFLFGMKLLRADLKPRATPEPAGAMQEVRR